MKPPRPFPALRAWLSAGTLAALVFLLSGAAPARTATVHSLAQEVTPIEPGEITRDENARAAREAQASFTPRIAMPKAVSADVDFIGPALPAPAGPPERPSFIVGREDYFRIGLVLLLLGGVTAITLTRHKEEEEIRALHGGYLSDGTEVASFKMPEFFAPQSSVEKPAAALAEMEKVATLTGEKQAVVQSRLDEFLEKAPELLAAIRKTAGDIGRATDDEQRKGALLLLHERVLAVRDAANFWEVRPVWQLTSALELLVKRVTEKAELANTSTLRTIANAVDLLHSLCARDIRPELIIEPPVQILSVEDDALCRRAVHFALQKIHLTPDEAVNGQQAVNMCRHKTYDVIFMDILMPEMDGLTACLNIHDLPTNADTPVVFVTVQADFATRAKSTVLGGTDLMAKPFLVFELTVKALTLVMRKRLQLNRSAQPAAAKPAPLPPPPAAPKMAPLPLLEAPVATVAELPPEVQAALASTAAPTRDFVRKTTRRSSRVRKNDTSRQKRESVLD